MSLPDAGIDAVATEMAAMRFSPASSATQPQAQASPQYEGVLELYDTPQVVYVPEQQQVEPPFAYAPVPVPVFDAAALQQQHDVSAYQYVDTATWVYAQQQQMQVGDWVFAAAVQQQYSPSASVPEMQQHYQLQPQQPQPQPQHQGFAYAPEDMWLGAPLVPAAMPPMQVPAGFQGWMQ